MTHTEAFPDAILLITGLARHPLIQPEIDRVYQTDPHTYEAAYQTSPFHEHPLFQLYPTSDVWTMMQLAGIYAFARESGDDRNLMAVIRKGFGALVRYTKKHATYQYNTLFKLGIKGKDFEAMDDAEITCLQAVISYLFYRDGQEPHDIGIFETWTTEYLAAQTQLLTVMTVDYGTIPEHKPEVRALIQRLQVKEMAYNNVSILHNQTEQAIAAVLAESGGNASIADRDTYLDVREHLFQNGGDVAIMTALLSLLKTFGIPDSLYGRRLTKKEWEDVLARFVHFKDKHHVPPDAQSALLSLTLVWSGFAKEYHETRAHALKTITGEAQRLRDQLEKDKKESEAALKKEADRLVQKERLLSEKETQTNEKIAQLERELRRAKDALAKKRNNETELIALRNHVYAEMETPEPVSPEQYATIAQLAASLQKLDAIIIGGHARWVRDMKELFPAFTFIGGNAVHADLSALTRDGAVVFFNTDSNSHAQYDRVTAVVNETNTPFHYLSHVTNIDRTILKMAEVLKD